MEASRGAVSPEGGPRPTWRRLAVIAWVVIATACVAVFGLSLDALVAAAGCAVLVTVTVTDLERRIIPNRVVVPALAVALAVQTARDPSLEWVLSAAAAGGVFLILALVYPAGLGMGDVKLVAFLGAWLGAAVFVALFAGSLLGAVAAVVVLVRHGAAGRKVGIPFAPFLAAGGVIAVFIGDRALDAWLG